MCEAYKELFSRNELYWGEKNQKKLAKAHVGVFGLGGVGGVCAETLVRAGIGEISIVDFDVVSLSNINRQIIALNSTAGQRKTKLFEKRLKDINPNLNLHVIDDFYTENTSVKNILSFNNSFGIYIADAIDTLRSKVALLEQCVHENIPIISSMGAGNRIDPTQLYICDISEIEEKNAPFTSNVIYQLKKLGIESGINVVASHEKPFVQKRISVSEKICTKSGEQIEFTKITPASTPFVASCAGIYMAYFIVRQIIEEVKK